MQFKKMVYLDPGQNRLLRRIATEDKISETEVVRRALDLYARYRLEDPLEKLIGSVKSGPTDGAVRHDEYIVRHRRAK